MGICQKGTSVFSHYGELGHRVTVLPQACIATVGARKAHVAKDKTDDILKIAPLVANNVDSVTLVHKRDNVEFHNYLGILHTLLCCSILWVYVCLHTPSFPTRFKIENVGYVLSNYYSLEK